MTAPVRLALTETVNAYPDMPRRVEDVDRLAGRLEDLRAANLEHHVRLADSAAAAGAHLLVCGELFAGPYFALHEHPVWRDLAEDARRGPSVTVMADVARRHGLVVVAPVYEREAGTGRRFNTAVVIDADGRVVGRYRKTHVPHGGNEQGRFLESFYYEPGRPAADAPAAGAGNPWFPVFDTAVGRLGVTICYDRHFEGTVRTLARRGARLIVSPAVTFGATSRRMWDVEFAVDAARHHVYVAGSNRLGREPPWNVSFFGAGYVAGPGGVLPADRGRPGLVLSDVDLAALERPSDSGWSLRRDARPDIYDR